MTTRDYKPAASLCTCLAAAAALSWALPALAHHSYAMFDMTKRMSVSGTMAKVDWSNPHVSVWVYVRKKDGQSGYELYAFEAGGANFLSQFGWTPKIFPPGEKVTIEYCPLRDGSNAGALIKVIHADGSETLADPLSTTPVNHCGVQS